MEQAEINIGVCYYTHYVVIYTTCPVTECYLLVVIAGGVGLRALVLVEPTINVSCSSFFCGILTYFYFGLKLGLATPLDTPTMSV